MHEPPSSATEPLASSRSALLVGVLAVLAAVAFGAWMRVHATLQDPAFDPGQAEGLLKSDPALLYYFVERILESGGGIPGDFSADPRILHPGTVDVWALFPLGMEFVIAWWRILTASDAPLHMDCLLVSSVLASTIAIGVYGLALELTRKVGWALAALAVCTFTWANYRTIGFLLVGEDFSMPWFALHLYMLARAARLRTSPAIALAAATWIVALATWHATSFFATIEAVLVWAWFARTGRNPLAAPRALSFLLVVALGALLVPILWSTRFAGSVPAQVLVGLAVAAAVQKRGIRGRARLVLVSIAAACLWLGLSLLVSHALGGGLAEYSHVFGLLAAKLEHGGQLPIDPGQIAPEVRLMWQGPFATSVPSELLSQFGYGLLVVPALLWASARAWWRGAGGPGAPLLGAGLAIGLVVAWLISRTVILPGLLLPVAVAWVGMRAVDRVPTGKGSWVVAAILGLGLVQAADCSDRVRAFASSWYQPIQQQAEIRSMLDAVRRFVPEGEAVATDFMNSTAILAHTRRPILLQPKYEDRESRRRAVEFFDAVFHGTPAALRRRLLDEYQCRYLVLDRHVLLGLSASSYLAGVRSGEKPTPGTVWELLATEPGPSTSPPEGYRLLYMAPPARATPAGSTSGPFRLYELTR